MKVKSLDFIIAKNLSFKQWSVREVKKKKNGDLLNIICLRTVMYHCIGPIRKGGWSSEKLWLSMKKREV
jgi:hypothetical protein